MDRMTPAPTCGRAAASRGLLPPSAAPAGGCACVTSMWRLPPSPAQTHPLPRRGRGSARLRDGVRARAPHGAPAGGSASLANPPAGARQTAPTRGRAVVSRARWLLFLLAFVLAGCTAIQRTPTPLPTVTLGGASAPTRSAAPAGSSGGVTASGVVAPAAIVELAAPMGEVIRAVPVAVGDDVAAGQTLIELDARAQQALLSQAQAGLATAQANYDLLAAGPTPQELRVAQAAVDQAQARLDGLATGPRAEQVAQAQSNLAMAQSRLRQLSAGPTEHERTLARLGVEQAKNARWGAQARRDGICGVKANPSYLCDAAEAEVLVAETGVQQAEARLAQLQAPPSAEALAQVREAVKVAEAQLALVRQPYTPHDLAAAQAQVAQAQAALDALKAGARAQQLAVAQSAAASAQAQVQAAELALERLTLRAPLAGTVTQLLVHGGEWVAPGQPLVALADLAHLRVETTDLSERDVPRVAVGQRTISTFTIVPGLAPPDSSRGMWTSISTRWSNGST